MRRSAACFALLALALAPFAYAGEVGNDVDPSAATEPATLVPAALATPVPTSDILSCDTGDCEQEDVRTTTFSFEPDPQSCMSYCTGNGWTFVDYCPAGRQVYLCICCAG